MNFPPLFSAHDIACERSEHTLFQRLGFELGAGEALPLRGGNGGGETWILDEPLAGLDVHGVAPKPVSVGD